MIFLLGGEGYVGQAFQRLFRERGVAYRSFSRSTVAYTEKDVLVRLLSEGRPDFLVNSAGYTGKPTVDACEADKANCLFANAVLPGRIAEACATAGIAWGHVSSGCIYTGTRADGSGFTESDPPNFTFRTGAGSFYSGTKALGEELLQGCPRLYIWRLRIPFDRVDHPRNYLTKLMRYQRLLDAINSLSQLREFVSACLACWMQRLPYGIYNVTNPGHVATREVVDLIRRSGVCRKDFAFFESEREFMQAAATAPRSNCRLDSSKLASAGVGLTEVHDAIERDLRDWRASA